MKTILDKLSGQPLLRFPFGLAAKAVGAWLHELANEVSSEMSIVHKLRTLETGGKDDYHRMVVVLEITPGRRPPPKEFQKEKVSITYDPETDTVYAGGYQYSGHFLANPPFRRGQVIHVLSVDQPNLTLQVLGHGSPDHLRACETGCVGGDCPAELYELEKQAVETMARFLSWGAV